MVKAWSPDGPAYELYAGAERVASRRHLDGLALEFGAHVRHFVAEAADGWVFLHAGAVAVDGHVVLFPGRSGAGKSTMVAELVRRGAVYFSDEYAVVDKQGLVHPFVKPISLRVPHGSPRLVDVREMGGAIGSRPLPAGAIVLTRYEAGASWRAQPMTPGATVLCLLDNAPAARSRFPAVRERILRLIGYGPKGWQGVRGDAGEVARWLGYEARG